MLSLARTQDWLLGCCSTRFLGLPTTAEVKRLIREHELGGLYRLTFVQRAQRNRPGVEYQPRSRRFLDRSQSGGGPTMGWGSYDFAAFNDVLAPVRVDAGHTWMSRPRTAADPPDVVFDIEEHVGANLRYHLADKTIVQVSYERAACTHGEPRSVMELEGTVGGVCWDWLMWADDRSVSVTKDQDGQPTTTTIQFERTDKITFHDRPLV